jgi:hypothetical protein
MLLSVVVVVLVGNVVLFYYKFETNASILVLLLVGVGNGVVVTVSQLLFPSSLFWKRKIFETLG